MIDVGIFIAWVFAFLIVLGLGFLAGILSKGVHITIKHEQEESPAPVVEGERQYNPSTEELLPEEVQLYYQKNQGFTE